MVRWLLLLFVLTLAAPVYADLAPERTHPRRWPSQERPQPAPPGSAPVPEQQDPRPADEDEALPWFLIGSMLVLGLSGVHLLWPRRDAVLDRWGIDAARPYPRRPGAR